MKSTSKTTKTTVATDVVTGNQLLDQLIAKKSEPIVVEGTIAPAPAAKPKVTKPQVDEKVIAEHKALMTPVKEQLPSGQWVIRVGEASILQEKMVAIGISLKSSNAGIAAAKQAARSIAENNANVVTVGIHEREAMQAMNACLESGANGVVVLPLGVKNFNFKPFEKMIVGKRMVFISPLRPDALQNIANTQVANKVAASLAHSLFVAECYATKANEQTGERRSKVWNLVEAFEEWNSNKPEAASPKFIYIPAITDSSRQEHSDIVETFKHAYMLCEKSDVLGENEDEDIYAVLTENIEEGDFDDHLAAELGSL